MASMNEIQPTGSINHLQWKRHSQFMASNALESSNSIAMPSDQQPSQSLEDVSKHFKMENVSSSQILTRGAGTVPNQEQMKTVQLKINI